MWWKVQDSRSFSVLFFCFKKIDKTFKIQYIYKYIIIVRHIKTYTHVYKQLCIFMPIT